MFAYCLFCQTQRCARIAQILEIKGLSRAFSPQILQRQRVKGENRKRFVDLLPGYVFVFCEEQLVDYSVFYGIDGVIRKVGQAGEWYELKGSDQVTLEDPLFANVEGRVTQIDFRKERARVDFTFRGNACHTWISLEDVKPKV